MDRNVIKLGELCEIKAGGTPSRSKNEYWKKGNIPWVKIGDLKSKYVNSTSEFITEEGLNNSSAKLFKKGTILYTIFATLGEVSILNIDATTNQAIVGIVHNNKIETEYLYYFLKSKKEYVNDIGRGVAQNNINLSILKDIDVYIPSIDSQQKIIRILNKAQELIDKRKEQIEVLDELVKSKFNEMFGNIVTNSYKWDMVKLKDICLLKSGGTPTRSKPEYFKGNIPWITTIALGKNLIDENDAVEYITQEAIKNSATKLIKEGSLLFGMRVGVGKISVNSVPMCTNQDIMAITEIDTSKYNLIFLKKIIESYSEYFNNQKRGATIQGIKSDTLKEINIPIIEIELQIKFVNFVKQVDKLKLEMEKSLKGLEDNFNSLMQRAFKGELFN